MTPERFDEIKSSALIAAEKLIAALSATQHKGPEAMTERFVTPCPLPTPYEHEVLTILIEECAEIQQRATKLMRFGRDEIQPGQPHSNMARMSAEIGDLLAVIDLAMDAGLVDAVVVEMFKGSKPAKLRKFMQTQLS